MRKTHLILLILVILMCNSLNITAQIPELWGMTSEGGEFSIGTIFKTDLQGNNYTVAHSINKYDAKYPRLSELCEASNGKLYGMTKNGGIFNMGVLFEYDPNNNSFLKLLDFDGSNGKWPYGSLVEASNGNLYGMTRNGGTTDLGVLFEYNPNTNQFTKKLDFDGLAKGRKPYGSLIQANNGKLYGMTTSGGTTDMGTLFEFDPSNSSYTKMLDFDGATNGSGPKGTLIQSSTGKLYGMTTYGGINNKGVLFEFDPTINSFSKHLDFDGTNNGKWPYGSLMESSNGILYGMTNSGGTNELGVLFEYNPSSSSYTKKVDFDSLTKGSNPQGSLIEANNAKIYGMTELGGTNNMGVLFEYDPSTSLFSKKLDFDDTNKGKNPLGSLMEASNGQLYGMTYKGGTNNRGVIFEYHPSTSSFIKVLDFDRAINGSSPFGSLMEAANGKLYAMTWKGGINNKGAIFEYNPSNDIYINIFSFDDTTSGKWPYGSLMEASNGNFYGTTTQGGANNKGVLFEFNPSTNAYTKKLDFDGTAKGTQPHGSLIEANNGKLYGLSAFGGTNDMGVLFEYDPSTNSYTKMLDFDGTLKGISPFSSLMEASNGNLYGMTTSGGINNLGVLFEFNISTIVYSKILDFDGSIKGASPRGSLMESSNGKLYGMTEWGGSNNKGVLFEYDPSNSSYTKMIDFDGTLKGAYPKGSLMEASNGKLYGMTNTGGANDFGVLFEYDNNTSTYAKKFDYNIPSVNPSFGHLIEVNTCYTVSNFSVTECESYTVPSGDETYTTIGNYSVMDTLTSSCGIDSVMTILVTILPQLTGTVNETLCYGESIIVNGTTYDANNLTGTEIFTNIGAFNCDSTVAVNLTILPAIDTTITTTSSSITANQTGATYQWLDCNNNYSIITGEIAITYTATTYGDYAVEITLGNCVDTSSCTNITLSGISENILFNEVSIYPNPSKGNVNIELGSLKNVSVIVYNSFGQLIYQKENINTPLFQFNLDESPGTYFIEIGLTNETREFTLIIK